jgi:hypothetical protein
VREEPGDREPGQEARPLVPVGAVAVPGKASAVAEAVLEIRGSPAVGEEAGVSAVSAGSEEHEDRTRDQVAVQATCPAAAALLGNQEARAVGAAEAAETILVEVHPLPALLSSPGSATPCRRELTAQPEVGPASAS